MATVVRAASSLVVTNHHKSPWASTNGLSFYTQWSNFHWNLNRNSNDGPFELQWDVFALVWNESLLLRSEFRIYLAGLEALSKYKLNLYDEVVGGMEGGFFWANRQHSEQEGLSEKGFLFIHVKCWEWDEWKFLIPTLSSSRNSGESLVRLIFLQ